MAALDQTTLFWDISLDVATQQGLDEARIRKLRSAQILRSLAAKTSFTLAAIELAAAVSQVTQLMQSQRQDYVQPGRMTQAQQDAVEHEMAQGLKACKENIQQLQSQIQKASNNAGQPTINTATAAHRQGVVLILTESLQSATDILDEARGQRRQQQVHQETQRKRKQRRFTPSVQTMNYQPLPPDGRTDTNGQLGAQMAGPQQELMQTETENRLLRHRLNTTRERATGIESSLADVGNLLDIFSHQVLQQSEQIETLYNEAVEQTVNIEKGNVQLTKAIKLSTSARKFTAVLMVVASLLVLGFDWYAS